ncbi:MAG: LLM class flavin-dependent oxidoreductase [Thaumarchaeota archaeon]|nr:LLM class flavin-dependent oxidoreductase [Nitrososphaerota archaeon]
MQFGVMLPVQGPVTNARAIGEAAKEAESLGYISAWVHDGHLTRQTNQKFSVCGSVESFKEGSDPDFYEPMTTLSYVAGATRSVKLGSCTFILPLYDPIILARQAAALDNLSNGRLIFGVSIGGSPALGKFFKIRNLTFEERGKIFDEYLRAIRALWSEPISSFQGNYIKFSDVEVYPKPRSKKIYVGASTKPRGIRRLAELADGWMPSHTLTPKEIRQAVLRIKEKQKFYGRDKIDFEVIQRSYACVAETTQEAWEISAKTVGLRAPQGEEKESSGALIGTKQDVLDRIQEFKEAGISHLGIYPIFRGSESEDLYRSMKTFAEEIIPHFDSDN